MNDFTRLMFLSEHMDTKEDVCEFEEKLSYYYSKSDEKTLVELLSLFTDKCPYYEVMWGLIHLVETWPEEVYLKTLLRNINISKAKFWITTLFYRTLNHPSSFEKLKNTIYKSKSLMQLFDIIEKE